MNSTQVKIYAGEDTYTKWQAICQGFSSNSAAFAALVENYHSQNKQEDTMNTVTVTLYESDLVDWITAMGTEDVVATVQSEIERYIKTLGRTLGAGWRVEVSPNVIGTMINGRPTSAADEEIRNTLADAEAYVSERFW